MGSAALGLALIAGCTGGSSVLPGAPPPLTASPEAPAPGAAPPTTPAAPSSSGGPAGSAETPGQVTIAFAGDVHFADRVADRLAASPATAFGEAAAVLSRADITMVNLETSISVGGTPANKSFTFQAPPTAFAALRAAGVDVTTMANNHAADYRGDGLEQTLAAIGASGFPTVGIGRDAAQAYAPWLSTVNGVRIAILGASQVPEETLRDYTAQDGTPGIASAYSQRLIDSVVAAKAQADVVVVYLHWGFEYSTCPNADQRSIADDLAAAGATAVVGTHAHVLQGAGWRDDGVYIAYGLSNYLWWMSFDNEQDDNGVLTLTLQKSKVAAAQFEPAHLDSRGVPLPATGAEAHRINAEWERDRLCANLSNVAPAS
ncbi:MAG: CapA family protein [Jatrophihabitantaceae bacterium]|nr:CapA family protein [Jatrophihabitantaceae bacterium]